jgi:hypothetical protein
MSIVKGTNSYVDLSEADSYFGDRLDSVWSTVSSTRKEQSLITAARMLDDLTWTGWVSSETQPLAFPRNGQYFDPRAGYNITLDGTNVPKRVAEAQMELAAHLLNNDGLLEDTGTVVDLQVSSIRLSTVKAPPRIPEIAMARVRPLLVNQGSSPWWRAW